jgi:hypothetical protein
MGSALSQDSQKVVRVLLQRPALSGGELASLTGLTPDLLYAATQELLQARVISINEPTFDANQIWKIYFNLNPSARPFAESAVR